MASGKHSQATSAPTAAGGATAPDGHAAAPLSAGLYVVGTPIGNLGDLSPRAAQTLAAADLVCCEDTRVTGKLLAAAGVRTPLMRCDENVIASRVPQLVERMLGGESVAFASDAGMPGVSDPGQHLVDAALDAGIPATVVPGPVACITALVASGIPSEHFFFEGFLPRRAGERERRLRALAGVPGALLLYESPHRIQATLDAVAAVFPNRAVALARELTKLHEEVLRALAPELAEAVRARGALKGEMVVVIAPPSAEELEQTALAAHAAVASGENAAPANPDEELRRAVADALRAGEGVSAIAKRLSQRFSRKKREVYELACSMRDELGEL